MGILEKQHQLKVYLSNISPQSQAILEFFISSTGDKYFKRVLTPTDAEAYIIDFDYPGSKEHWQVEHGKSAKPCIAFSIKDPHNELVDWVAKPLSAKALIAAAQTISLRIEPLEVTPVVSQTASQATIANKRPTSALPEFTFIQSPFRKKTQGTAPTSHYHKHPNAIITKTAATSHHLHNDVNIAIVSEQEQTHKAKANLHLVPVKKTPIDTTETPLKAAQTKAEDPATQNDFAQHTDTNVTAINPQKHTKNKENRENRENGKEQPVEHPPLPRKPYNPYKAQEREEMLCGEIKHISLDSLQQDKTLKFNAEYYFQGTLIAGLRLAKQTRQVVQIKFEPHQFYICYDEFLIFSPLAPESDDYADLCSTLVKPGQVNLNILSSTESADIRQKIHPGAKSTFDLESFIWTSCLLTSKGRVPSALDYEVKYLLKFWPNFTRIEIFPYAMKTAARWQKKPYTVFDLAKEMDIPLQYTVAFFNGVSGLSLFETDLSKIQNKPDAAPSNNKGLIMRLFDRLTHRDAPANESN